MVILKRPQSAMLFQHHKDGSPGPMRSGKPLADGPEGKTAQKRATILLVDDDSNMLSSLRRFLRRIKHDSRTATNGRKGLEEFKQGGIDLVISDRQMPVMGGLDLLKELKEYDPDVKVIILSGGMPAREAEEFMKTGAFAVMAKPYDEEVLRGMINRALVVASRDLKEDDGCEEPAAARTAVQQDSGTRTVEQKSITILVVDDDNLAMKTGCAIVKRMGHEFKTADDGRKGLEVFKQGGIDLVLSDRQMPNMDGLELLKELKKLDPDVKVIVVSGNMRDEDKAELYEAGAAAVMDKPYDMKELMETIRNNLE
jgi:DNA-binding NtrC family response regulator